MIIVIRWILFILGILLSLVCINTMLMDSNRMNRLASFISGIVYLLVIFQSAYFLFINR